MKRLTLLALAVVAPGLAHGQQGSFDPFLPIFAPPVRVFPIDGIVALPRVAHPTDVQVPLSFDAAYSHAAAPLIVITDDSMRPPDKEQLWLPSPE